MQIRVGSGARTLRIGLSEAVSSNELGLDAESGWLSAMCTQRRFSDFPITLTHFFVYKLINFTPRKEGKVTYQGWPSQKELIFARS